MLNTTNIKFVLTRYLYIYDEVKLALLFALLEKQKTANFWGYELYHSGFKKETMEWLWTIYYDFFAILNPSFENFFLTKEKEDSELMVKVIIDNLLNRPFTTDIFILYKNFEETKVENKIQYLLHLDLTKKSDLYEQIAEWIKMKDFISISQFVLFKEYQPFTEITIYEMFLLASENLKESYLKQFKKISRCLPKLTNKILLSKIFTLFPFKKGKNTYTQVNKEDLLDFHTLEPKQINSKHYRFLNHVCKYSINEHHSLCIFDLERYNLTKSARDIYNREWLYYASFTPLWLERIKKYQGIQDHEQKQVIFPSDDEFDDFHNEYDYETDEQSADLKERVIPEMKKEKDINRWIDFCKKYNQNNIIYKVL